MAISRLEAHFIAYCALLNYQPINYIDDQEKCCILVIGDKTLVNTLLSILCNIFCIKYMLV